MVWSDTTTNNQQQCENQSIIRKSDISWLLLASASNSVTMVLFNRIHSTNQSEALATQRLMMTNATQLLHTDIRIGTLLQYGSDALHNTVARIEFLHQVQMQAANTHTHTHTHTHVSGMANGVTTCSEWMGCISSNTASSALSQLKSSSTTEEAMLSWVAPEPAPAPAPARSLEHPIQERVAVAATDNSNKQQREARRSEVRV
jgi:hypothetical protein